MSDSPNRITAFLSEYQKNKSLVSLISSVNNKAYSDLKDGYKLLLENCRWLVQYYYIAHSTRDFTLEELSVPLKGITQLSVASSLRLFSKPNHKDRYSYLMFYLREHSDLFAQVIYFSLLTPSNPTISYQDLKFLSQDDLIYFCFTTFPAIYNFFLTIDDQMAGVSLINNLFSLHFSIHGMNFGKPHKFLSYLVSSLFLSTNPGTFFEMSVFPLIRKYGVKLEEVRFQYTKVGDNLVRETYWTQLVDFTSLLIDNLIKNAPLLPATARFLINKMLQFENSGFPFAELFVIDAMICDFLENRLLTSKPVLMRDVCNILRCRYPQTIIPSPVSTTLNLLHLDLEAKIDLKKLINSIKIEKFENDQLTASIRTMEEMSLFTPRDLSLIHTMLNFFISFADQDKISDLASSFKGLTQPNSNAEDNVLCLKSWNSSQTLRRVTPKNFEAGRDFDEIIDCTSSINLERLEFGSAHELSRKALDLCGSNLNVLQKIRMNNIKPDFEKQVDAAIDGIQSNRSSLEGYSDILSTAIFAMTAENQRNSAQIKRSIGLYLRVKFIPNLFELFPTPDSILINNNFYLTIDSQTLSGANLVNPASLTTNLVNVNNMPKNKAENARVALLLSVLDNLSARFALLKNQDSIMKKEYATIYIDQREKTQGFQKGYLVDKQKEFNEIVRKLKDNVAESTQYNSRLTDQVLDSLNSITVKDSPSDNLRTLFRIFKLMSRLNSSDKSELISKTENIEVFAFAEFVKNHINEKLADIMFTKNEKNYIHQFVAIIDRIKLMK